VSQLYHRCVTNLNTDILNKLKYVCARAHVLLLSTPLNILEKRGFFFRIIDDRPEEKITSISNVFKVVDSRPARSAGRVKKNCFETLENFCVCYEGSILSCKVIKIHPVLHADEFSISKNTQNANFAKIWLKQGF